MTKINITSEELSQQIVEAIQEKKGEKIKVLDLRHLDHAISDYFVVCEAQSKPQIDAIFDSIDELVKKNLGEDPVRVEGREEANWILVDYFDVVAHIFKPEAREFYKLEDLWSDANITSIK